MAIFNSMGITFQWTSLMLHIRDAITALKQYGIYHNPVTFEIVTLNKKHMILKNDDAVITLRKF